MPRVSKAVMLLLQGKAEKSDPAVRGALTKHIGTCVADRVRDLLVDQGMSREELTRRLGDAFKQSRVTRILNGEASITLALVVELANAFRMSPAEFLAPLLFIPDDVEQRRYKAREELDRELTKAREELAKLYAGGLDRPGTRRVLSEAVAFLPHLSDAELEFFERLLFSFAEFWGRQAWEGAQAEAYGRYRARLGLPGSEAESAE